MQRLLKRLLKRLSWYVFVLGDRVGIHILPKHYYTPVPDMSWLRSNRSLWARPTTLSGVVIDPDAQLDWLRSVVREHEAEVRGLRTFREITGSGVGPGYGPIEWQVLHCAIRKLAPPLVVEIGSGVSTETIARAVELNVTEGRSPSTIVAIEPYPSRSLTKLSGVNLIRKLVQEVGDAPFDQLSGGDLLFVDSSHSVRVGSELQRIYLEIIPRLRPGVVVHVHDIFLPYLYSPDVLSTYFGWQETTLLAALLTANPRLQIAASLSILHHTRPRELAAILPDYVPRATDRGLYAKGKGHFPSSIWLLVR